MYIVYTRYHAESNAAVNTPFLLWSIFQVYGV